MMKSNLFNPFFVIPIMGLSGLSLAIISSTSPNLFLSQLIFFVIGVVLYILFAEVDYRIFRNLAKYLYAFSIILLLLVFLGPNVRGATRWVDIAGFRLQSSEIIKPFIFIVFSYLLSTRPITKPSNLIFSILLFLPLIVMVFKQPDLGNAIVYFGVFALLLISAGINWIYLFLSGVASLLLVPFIWSILHAYQRSRIISFFNPYTDPRGAGYNALQAVIAIGASGFWGLGLGRGTQSHLLFLPEYHTDFVFASLVEEFGLFGGLVIIAFYAILLSKILSIAFKSDDLFGRLISLAFFSQILLQVFINIGMNIGILPITGITLPLVSYGGSSIISMFISLGILVSIGKRENYLS